MKTLLQEPEICAQINTVDKVIFKIVYSWDCLCYLSPFRDFIFHQILSTRSLGWSQRCSYRCEIAQDRYSSWTCQGWCKRWRSAAGRVDSKFNRKDRSTTSFPWSQTYGEIFAKEIVSAARYKFGDGLANSSLWQGRIGSLVYRPTFCMLIWKGSSSLKSINAMVFHFFFKNYPIILFRARVINPWAVPRSWSMLVQTLMHRARWKRHELHLVVFVQCMI